MVKRDRVAEEIGMNKKKPNTLLWDTMKDIQGQSQKLARPQPYSGSEV
jgi:hypothetical protein